VITERTLRQIAGRARLGVGQTEHEYVVICALDALTQTPLLADALCLKGGTALRQFYFPDWRYSVDLDFSALPAFPAEALRPGLEAWFGMIGARHGVQVILTDFHRANGAARLRARCVGPLRHPRPLLLDVTLDEPIVLSTLRRDVVTGLFSELAPKVLCYALEEIVAEKLRSVLQRGKARDYYDVWRLLKEKATAFDHQVARQVFRAKCRHKGLPDPTPADCLDPAALKEAGLYWDQELAAQLVGAPSPAWDMVVMELGDLLTHFLA
jgi:predicted nucleotidyltransferase component of viral defense system